MGSLGAIDLDAVNVIIQAIIGFATVTALLVTIKNVQNNKRQYEEEKTSAADAEARKQAEKVAAWFENNRKIPSAENKSQYVILREVLIRNENLLPIYEVVLTVVGRYGAGRSKYGEKNSGDYKCRLLFSELPCGLWGQHIPTDGSGMHTVDAVEIAFTDSRGNSWVRRGSGALEKLSENPISFYKISRPCEWSGRYRIDD